ncbi:hypothetical protein OG754_18410 [Streptomyces decoyicus]|uniref:hypothetical protein n=1 Tax=Streptomyces decoyicus TaxID=249567 RepID=UPI002E3175E2|nr:hypothetical protein [Streptomyces decoyicus]
MTNSFATRRRRGLVLVFAGIAAVLVGANAHFLTNNATWSVLTVAGLLVQSAGWVLFVRDGRQS